jgi:hypothetical protein
MLKGQESNLVFLRQETLELGLGTADRIANQESVINYGLPIRFLKPVYTWEKKKRMSLLPPGRTGNWLHAHEGDRGHEETRLGLG